MVNTHFTYAEFNSQHKASVNTPMNDGSYVSFTIALRWTELTKLCFFNALETFATPYVG